MGRRRSLPTLVVLGFVLALAALLPQAGADSTRVVILVDRAFKCGDYPQPLDLALVKVTLTESYDRRFKHAVALRGKCSGRIERLEVDTWIGVGVQVGKGARDLVVEGGHIRCWSRRLSAQRRHDLHQDGVIAMGGIDVTLRGLVVDCRSANHAALYFTRGRGGDEEPTEGDWPTRVVCDGCTLSAPGQLVDIHASISSGARNSFFACKPRLFKVRSTEAAVDPVNENNRLLSAEPCPASTVSRRGAAEGEEPRRRHRGERGEERDGKRHRGQGRRKRR